MPSKEEAEAMAEAILAAHRTTSGRSKHGSPARTNASLADSGAGNTASTPWVACLVTGALVGAIVGSLPSPRMLLGLVVGLVVAGAVAAIVHRFGR